MWDFLFCLQRRCSEYFYSKDVKEYVHNVYISRLIFCMPLLKKYLRYIFCFLFTDFRILLVSHGLLSCLCLLWLASLIGACLSTILFRVLIASCTFSFRFFSGLRISCQSISFISSKYRSLLNLE